MRRRTFLIRTSGWMISVAAGLSPVRAAPSVIDRVGMGTVIFRNRFEQTNPDTRLKDPLTLLNVPAYYRERFDFAIWNSGAITSGRSRTRT